MKKLMLIGLLVSGLSFSMHYFNGKVVNGECTYPIRQRKRIVDKLIRYRKSQNKYVYLDMVADDFETVIRWYDLDKKVEFNEKLQFCKIPKTHTKDTPKAGAK